MESWDEIVSQYYANIYAYAFHLLRSKADAEDITQDTFIRAKRALPTLKNEATLKAWLYSIARNLVIDKQRSLKRFFNYLNTKEQVSVFDQKLELGVMLTQLIEKLPRRQKEVFILRHWHEFSTEETAELLKIDAGSVKSHLSRAITKLKSELSASGVINELTTKSTVKSSLG